MLKIRSIASTITACLLLSTLSGAPLYAQSNDQSGMDKAQAAKRAQEQVKGRVLRVDQNNGTYRVKVLQKSGRVVSVDVDKRSGRVTPEKKKKDK